MSSKQSLADFIIEQIENAGTVSAKKMFGEYGIFCNGKMVALICDDQFFVKPTIAGRAHIEDITEDSEWLTKLIKITAAELPIPKKKKKGTAH
jgi:DNA transformation protein